MIRTHIALPALLLVATSVPSIARADASAELYNTQPYYYGRFEARIRFAAGDGVVSSFFLWKEGSEVQGTFWNELDFEKVGANCQVRTNALYGNPESSHHGPDAPGNDLCSDYHDYRFEWTPTYIAWGVDGQEIGRADQGTADAFAQNASDGMTFHFNVWPGDESFGGNYNPAILPVYQYISWVEYSSYDNGTFNLEWREEFDGGALPSGWAVGDWGSPKGRSTHSPNNVGFVDGIAVLALTTDGATGVPSTVPPDGTASGGTSTGGTSSGGAETGGSATGGTDSGGSATGGAAVGGTGGEAAGGASTGGVSTGGIGVGGGVTGGANTGGLYTGGTDPGSSGGAVTTGGLGAGGTATGGASIGSGGWTSGATGGSSDTGTGGDNAIGGGLITGGTTVGTGGDGQGASNVIPGSAGEEDAGCTCRVQSGEEPAGRLSALGLGALLLLWRRSHRRRNADGKATPTAK